MASIKPELLAPCGSPEALRAAVAAGADAVYLGGEQFNARLGAKNFDEDALAEGIKLCHGHGVKVYITLNTQIYDRKMDAAVRFAARVYELGADALIITDLGLISLLRELVPDLPLHASTQLMGGNAAAARFAARLGMERMVCARELSREDITALCEQSPIEIEAFVHGAICASQSGGCLFSSMIGGRSGNRGECAQPCRLPYNGSYPLSIKDMCLATHMRELINTGVSSLKIEGRMKGSDYVRGVISVYRTLIDEERDADGKEMAQLAAVFSRSGFTDRYFTGKIDGKMLGVRTDADKAAKAAAIKTPKVEKKPPITNDRKPLSLPDALPKAKRAEAGKAVRSARFYDPAAIPDTDYFNVIFLPLDRYTPRANGVMLPPVIPPSEYGEVKKALSAARSAGARHVLVCNIGALELARESGMEVHLDYRFNVYNSHSAALLSEYGEVMLSPELTLPQMRDVPAHAAVVYGRLPLMTLERPTGMRTLTDRRGVRFPVIKEGKRELVLNSVPIYMADREKDLRGAGITHSHFIFTVEKKDEVLKIIESYKKKAPAKGAFTRIKTK